MATYKIGNFPAAVDLCFTLGDVVLDRVNFGVDISANTYTAGITDELGAEVTTITCTPDTTYVDLSLTELQTEALPVNGREVPALWWYFEQTDANGDTMTLLKGRCLPGVK